MPAVSKKQRGLMALCANHPERAIKKCPPEKVAREFEAKPKKRSGLKALHGGY